MSESARVLVVDDDEGIRDALRLVLEDAGYHVADAGGGQQALEAIRASAERMVVLLDNFMPTLDGAAFLGAVAADGALLARHGYVLVTASPNALPPATRDLLARLGVPLLRKPFNIEDLLAVVEQVAARIAAWAAPARD